MRAHFAIRWFWGLACSVALLSGQGAERAPESGRDAADAEAMELMLGGAGGVYLLAAPGELTVDVEKRDLNRRGTPAVLRAILLGPDRQVLDQATIPDDGKPRGSGRGPVQRVRLSTTVQHPGVFGVNITVSQDRYGEEAVWGFRTNCPRYVIETSRGHRDERHQEPIVLANPDRPVDICFLPRPGKVSMELANLAESVREVRVYDDQDRLLHTLPVDSQRSASHTFAADAARGAAPWRLHLPVQQATVHIDGVTRWDSADPNPNLGYWTTKPSAYFPFQAYRWLLAPYNLTVYGQAGAQGTARFRVANNSRQPDTIDLDLESLGGPFTAGLSAKAVKLGVDQAREISIGYTVPQDGQPLVCRLLATPQAEPSYTTYSTLTVRAGEPPANRPIDVPLTLRPYEHENQQFGYLPDYPVEYPMYFDLKNRPYTWTGRGVMTRRAGQWVPLDLAKAVRSADAPGERERFSMASPKIAFDADNNLYLLCRSGRSDWLLRSADGGDSFEAFPLPRSSSRGGVLDFEQFSGHNVPTGAPPIVRFTQTAADPDRIWRRINDLELILFEQRDGQLVAAEPVMISRECIGFSAHSGAPSTIVSRGDRVHIIWAEATDPQEKVPGVPTFVNTYDRTTRQLGKPMLVGYGPPANDVHNTPSITMDSQGFLHALSGTHGQPFPYARSQAANDSQAGWTEPKVIGENLRQTYIGFVCGAQDALHAAYRLWQTGAEPHPHSHHAVLAHSLKPAGADWQTPQQLVLPPFSEYSVYYHRLTIDRRGRLFLSYDYWSTFWFYRTDHFGSRRALLMSPDGGQTWKLAASADFDE